MGFSSSERSSSSFPSRPRVDGGGPFSGSGLGVGVGGGGGMGGRFAATTAAGASNRGGSASCGGGGGSDGDTIMGETVINGSYFGEGVSASTKGGSGGTSGSGGGGGHGPHTGQQQHPQAAHGAPHGPGVSVNGGRPGGGYLHVSAPARDATGAVRGHRPRNTSASCGSYSAIANDGSLVVIGGVGAAAGGGGGGGFLDQPQPPPPDLASDFDPPARLQRNLSLPGVLREGGGQGQGQGQGQAFVSTPPSGGPKGGGGYFSSAVPTPGGGSGGSVEGEGGGRGGDCSGQEAYPAEGEQFVGYQFAGWGVRETGSSG